MTDMPEVAMDVKGLCERLVNEASDGWTGDAVCVDAALAAEAATALQSLAKELAEARAERADGTAEIGWATLSDWAGHFRQAALNSLAGSDRTGLLERARQCQDASDRALAAESASASKDERIRELEAEVARVQSDREYIIGFNAGWDEAAGQTLTFPTMLRKMWSGNEVQQWIDKQMAELRARSTKEPT